MKCEKCSKPATYHITDIERGKPHEYHFCEEHARQHLAPEPSETAAEPAIEPIDEDFIKGGALGIPDPGALDQKTCPICRITFGEFRNSGRLGCPYDYEVFHDELMPLLENIHEETRHTGKTPRRAPRDPRLQTQLIQLRNDQKRAIAAEDYEKAARIRDEIRSLEIEMGR
ncbi:MAG: UvrB/UvrC motif-containing protein [Isosphaeraceae bacterium]|nr:UvrB/UvrC motif-containing protein [Isosphaeraceae bacterium]